MDASKSSGPYCVPVTILKTIRDYISEPLAFLVNDSFASGNFPEKLKLARVTPVFKKGSRFDKDNYRPLSVLSNFRESSFNMTRGRGDEDIETRSLKF